MSGYPIVLDGSSIEALVVGGGEVAARKVFALLGAGARVHVVAPVLAAGLDAATDHARLRVSRERYSVEHLAGATLIFAATSDAETNARVAADAKRAGKLVNVADAPRDGHFVTPAVHRAGDVLIAVVAGGVPRAASRIRDLIAELIDGRYGRAVDVLGNLRRDLLDRGDRAAWRNASSQLIGENFRADVESGCIATKVDAWR